MMQYISSYLFVSQLPLIILLNFSFTLFCFGLVGIIWNKKNFLVLLFWFAFIFKSVKVELCLIKNN